MERKHHRVLFLCHCLTTVITTSVSCPNKPLIPASLKVGDSTSPVTAFVSMLPFINRFMVLLLKTLYTYILLEYTLTLHHLII